MSKNNSFRVCSSVSAYHKAKRGGDKGLINSCEKKHYNNDFLIKEGLRYYNRQQRYNNINSKIMAKQNLIDFEKKSGLGYNVYESVKNTLFDSFCVSLLNQLCKTASASCGVGRVSYAALIAAWRKDTANCTYRLNNNEGRKLYTADPNDSRVRRVGVEGHWSFFVCPKADELAGGDSDSIAVLVRCWLSSWLSWYDSVVCYGHYTGVAGVYSTGSALDGVLGRYVALWSHRGRGGRAALPDSVKAEKKAEKAVGAIDDDTALLILAKKLGLSVAALKALQAGKTDEKKD